MKAADIEKALRQRHREDFFFDEVLLGSSGSIRMDGWAMKPSWAHPAYIGYEIKVSVGDFRQDEKWHKYLPYCSHFYFVCPWKMIDPSEIGDGAGLMFVTSTGRCIIKKKAPRLKFDPERIMILLKALMMHKKERDIEDEDYWQQWLSGKLERQLLGRSVSKKLQKDVRDKIHSVEEENQRLKYENERLAECKAVIEKLGFKNTPYKWALERKLSSETAHECDQILNASHAMIGRIEAIRDRLRERAEAEATP